MDIVDATGEHGNFEPTDEYRSVHQDDRYRNLVELAPMAILLVKDFNILYVNKTAIKMFGADSADDLVNTNSLRLVHPDHVEQIKHRKAYIDQDGFSIERVEIKRLRLDGSEFYSSDSASMVEWQGKPAAMVAINDITETKMSEITVAESEQRFRDFAISTADRLWETDKTHKLTYSSNINFTGVSMPRDEVLGKKRWELKGAIWDDRILKDHRADLAARRPFKDVRFHHKMDSGETRYLRSYGVPFFDQDDEFQGYRGATTDETAEVLARQQAEKLEKQFITAIENISEGFSMWGPNEEFVYCNEFFRAAHDKLKDTLQPGVKYKNFMRALAYSETISDAIGNEEEWFSERYDTFSPVGMDFELVQNNQWIQLRKYKLDDNSIIVIYRNVTAEKLRDDALRDREKWLRSITNSIPAFVAYIDRQMRYKFANEYFQRVGLDPAEMIGKSFAEIFGEESYERVKPFIDRVFSGETLSWENEMMGADGKIFTKVSATPDRDKDGNVVGMFVLSMDVTEHKLAQEKLELNKSMLDAAQRIARVGSWERIIADNILTWSDEMYRNHGLDPEIETITFDKFINLVVPVDRPKFSNALADALEGGPSHWGFEYRIIRSDNRERTFHAEGELAYDENSVPIGLTGTAQDITERRHAQDALEITKRTAEQANRAKSEFLSSMSHELRTPMNAILGYAQLLLQNQKELMSDRQRKQVNQILKSGNHLLRLINDILDLSKIETGNIAISLQKISPRAAIDESIALVTSLAERNDITLIDQTANRILPTIFTDEIRLKQALLNLLSNAIKYNRPKGMVTLDCQKLSSGRIKISVKDTGIGIPENRQDELFEPFSRLGIDQSAIEGTGIGLTITRQLIQSMGGQVEYSSIVGVGSVFWIELPGASEQLVDDPSRIPHFHDSKMFLGLSDIKNRKLLYIEDDESNLRLMDEVIDYIPYLKLLSATSAEIGLQIARDQAPDVIVMDINLPGIDGFEALGQLLSDPKISSIPVIALSAAAMASDIRRGLEAGFKEYLTKPFVIDDMISTLDKVLKSGIDQSGVKQLTE